jgi:hypothetical protein
MKIKFRRNVNALDRTLRVGIGVPFMYYGFYDTTLIQDQLARALLGGMGFMLVLIAIIAWCPMYYLIGFSTISDKA